MKKFLISEHQADSLLYGLLNEREILTEGKFTDSIKALASEYFPSFVGMLTHDELQRIETPFVANQVTSSEARKWIIAMVIKGYGDKLLAEPELYAQAVKRFLANKALIRLNGNNDNLFTGTNEANIELKYTTIDAMLAAAEPREISLLKKAVSNEGAGRILYEDSEVIALELTKSTPSQILGQDIISGWCTKREGKCNEYAKSGHLCDILYKGGQNPFKDDDNKGQLYSMSGSVQLWVKRDVGTAFANTTRNSYGSDVEIRNKQNSEISLGKLFDRYNPKLLSALARGIIGYIQRHGMLFWFNYTSNDDVKRQFPAGFIKNIDKANQKALQAKVAEALGVDGTLFEAGLMKYGFTTIDGDEYIISINNAITQSKIKTEVDPKETFKRMFKRKMKTNIISYNNVQLMDLDKPETFVKYIDIKQMASTNPLFAALSRATISPEMIGRTLFKHYKDKYPTSSNIEIYNSYFEPYLNTDSLYNDYLVKTGNSSVEAKKVTVSIPIYKHELTSLLLRSTDEIEDMPSMVLIDVDVTQNMSKTQQITDTTGSME